MVFPGLIASHQVLDSLVRRKIDSVSGTCANQRQENKEQGKRRETERHMDLMRTCSDYDTGHAAP